MRALRFLSFVLLSAACASARAEPWERPDHTPPTAAETFYCHDEARRLAAFRYPDRPANEDRGLPRLEDDRKFSTETRLYAQCMTRSGFVRMVAPRV
jgi:hypothetical protein